MFKRNQKGFTLIELMIVIAIIGILAAIAIPQFAQYRMRSYNSSGQSDVRNLSTSEAAHFADWQSYGESSNDNGTTYQTLITGPSDANNDVIGGPDPAVPATNRDTPIPVGNGVSVFATGDGAGANGAHGTFSAVSKHVQGDDVYGADADTTAIYVCPDANCVVRGTAIDGSEIPATTIADDFAAAGPPWQAK